MPRKVVKEEKLLVDSSDPIREAKWFVETHLHDAAYPESGRVLITVHKLGKRIPCNVWLKARDDWSRLVHENVLGGKPHKSMLNSELKRFIKSRQDLIQSDFRWRMALEMLEMAIARVI